MRKIAEVWRKIIIQCVQKKLYIYSKFKPGGIRRCQRCSRPSRRGWRRTWTRWPGPGLPWQHQAHLAPWTLIGSRIVKIDIFLGIPPSSSVSSSPPPSSPAGSWSSTTALRVGRADKERFCLFFFLSNFFLSIFTALLVGRADEEQFWNFFCDSLTVRNFYAKSNSWLFLHLKLVKPRARPKVNQWHLFAIKTFWSLYIDQRHWYVCLKNCTLINLKVTDLKSQCPDWWKWWVSTSGRSMDWERKNVSRWIFFEIGRW